MPNALDLYASASSLLTAAEASLDTLPALGGGLRGAPNRSYVAPGEPAADCEQLTVHVQQIIEAPISTPNTPMQIGRSAAHHIRLNQVGFLISVFRECIDAASPNMGTIVEPSAADLELQAQQLYADAWALWHHLFNLIGAGELFELCGNVVFAGARSIPPSGGVAGWVLALTARVDGYEETI